MQVADLTERRNLLMAMLDAVYVDIVEEKSVVAIRPKPAFRPIFEVATTRGGSGIILINETPPDPEGPEAESLCSWWRRGRVELRSEHARGVGRRLYSKTNECPEGELYWIRGQQHGPLGRPIPRPVMAEMGGGEIG